MAISSRARGTKVASFKEKPDLDRRPRVPCQGKLFLEQRDVCLYRQDFCAGDGKICPGNGRLHGEAVANGTRDGRFFRFEANAMEKCPSDSIDYALMEKTAIAAVVAADLGWSDIGSWKALWDVLEKDDNGNVTRGDVLLEDTRNCLVQSENKLVATVGMEDTLVVETADAILVAPLSRSQDVKKVVTRLKKEQQKRVQPA